MEEVEAERKYVNSVIEPLLESTDVANFESTPNVSHQALVECRDDLPPVIVNKLRKVYPGKGKLPKVALASLDLHVPVSNHESIN